MSFTFSSAGHLPFYLLRSGSLLKMHCPGSALRIDPNAVYIGKAVGVRPGDRIVLYTDGLIETGAKGVEDEAELFESILKKYAKRKDLNDAVISGLKKRTGISAFIDDVTMLSLDLSS